MNKQSRKVTALVGVTCFVLGSVALVHAGVIPQGRIVAIADAVDSALTVRVNAAGELAAADEGARSRLDTLNAKLAPLAYDDQGNVRVAA